MKNRLQRTIAVDGKPIRYEINRRGCKGRWTRTDDEMLARIVAAAVRQARQPTTEEKTMNVDSGHLVRDIDEVEEISRDKYDAIPKELQNEARLKLNGRDEVTVDVDRDDSKLAKWARKRRADRKRSKRKRIEARASRRRNRGR